MSGLSPASTTTTPPSTPTTTTSSTPTDSTSTASTPVNTPTYPTTTTSTTNTPPVTPTGRTTTTSTTSLILSESSTSIYVASSTLTSDGQIYTTQISVTTVLTPGSVVTSTSTSSTQDTSSSSTSNTGAIVGAVVGGIAAIGLLGLLFYFLFNKKRRLRDEFDGNFDPQAVAHNKHPSLGGEGATKVNSTARPASMALDGDEDDGMGGRIARGAGGGGVISPYPFASPPTHQQQQMSQYAQGGLGVQPGALMPNIGAYNNENTQQQGHHRNPSSTSSGTYAGMPARTSYDTHAGGRPSSGSFGYQPQAAPYGQFLQGQPYAQGQGQQYAQGQGHPSLSPTNTGAGPGQGYANAAMLGYNPYAPPIGRGPSPGPSVGRSDTMSQSQYSASSAAGSGGIGSAGGGGRTAKEVEAFGGSRMNAPMMMGLAGMPVPHVANPDEGSGYAGQPQRQQQPAAEYYGSGGQGGPSAGASSSVTTMMPVQPDNYAKTGLITLAPSPSLVQHRDAGRVEEVQREAGPNEIPPAYDSLPVDVQR